MVGRSCDHAMSLRLGLSRTDALRRRPESCHVFRCELNPHRCPEFRSAEMPEIVVEILHPRSESQNIYPTCRCSVRQFLERGSAGGIIVAGDIQAPQRGRKQQGSQVIGRKGRNNG
jgi:hypothetical protein